MIKGILLAILCGYPLPAKAQGRSTDSVQWKLFFNQMFALELRKEVLGKAGSDQLWQDALKRYTAYTPNSFNESIAATSGVGTSSEAYRMRQKVFDNPQNYALISQLSFAASIPSAIQEIAAVSAYLRGIEANRNRAIGSDENFFTSPEAANFIEALAYGKGKAKAQQVAMIMMPGYAAHAIKFGIFPEIAADMNTVWGREAARPLLGEANGIDLSFEDAKTYYGKSAGGPSAFDMLAPAGTEMGNTVGAHAETAELLAKWLQDLPPRFSNSKLILFGYSRGAPVVLEMLKRHPELKSRVIGLVTYGGVIQGTHVARSTATELRAYLGKRSIAEVVDMIRSKGVTKSIDAIAPFISSFDLGFLKMPVIKDIMDLFEVDSAHIEAQVDRLMEGREVRELLAGADDLAPVVRTAWNLRNFDNDLLDPGTFIFNLSGIADISMFASRLAANNQRQRSSALITPKLKDDGRIDWQSFSLDAWFLYLSSLEGFKMAPGGLYDTQVDLQHGKTPWLDQSPLSASLLPEELASLWGEDDIRKKMQASGITSLAQFSNTPRSELLGAAQWNHIRAYDLGEFKGHHWSLFHQAFRAPPDVSLDHAIWEFPRKAFMRALLQTIALYNVVLQNS